jgi:hypothetical protein
VERVCFTEHQISAHLVWVVRKASESPFAAPFLLHFCIHTQAWTKQKQTHSHRYPQSSPKTIGRGPSCLKAMLPTGRHKINDVRAFVRARRCCMQTLPVAVNACMTSSRYTSATMFFDIFFTVIPFVHESHGISTELGSAECACSKKYEKDNDTSLRKALKVRYILEYRIIRVARLSRLHVSFLGHQTRR